MTTPAHLDGMITSAYLNDPDDRTYRALMDVRAKLLAEQEQRQHETCAAFNARMQPMRDYYDHLKAIAP